MMNYNIIGSLNKLNNIKHHIRILSSLVPSTVGFSISQKKSK